MSDAILAARLLAHGMDHRRRRVDDPDYDELAQRWEADPAFATLVRDIAMGFGIDVVEVNGAGIFEAPAADSLFHWGRREYDRRLGLKAQERLLHGIAHVAIAARAFPSEHDLAESGRREITVDSVERLLTAECERLRAEHGEADVRADQPGVEQAWRLWHNLPRSGDQRETARSRCGIIGRCLRILEELGFLTGTQGRGGVYRTTERYRVHVRDLAGAHAYSLLARAAVETA